MRDSSFCQFRDMRWSVLNLSALNLLDLFRTEKGFQRPATLRHAPVESCGLDVEFAGNTSELPHSDLYDTGGFFNAVELAHRLGFQAV